MGRNGLAESSDLSKATLQPGGRLGSSLWGAAGPATAKPGQGTPQESVPIPLNSSCPSSRPLSSTLLPRTAHNQRTPRKANLPIPEGQGKLLKEEGDEGCASGGAPELSLPRPLLGVPTPAAQYTLGFGGRGAGRKGPQAAPPNACGRTRP